MKKARVKGRFFHKELKKIPFFNFVELKIRTLSQRDHIPGVGVVHVALPPRYTHVPVCHKHTREWLMILSGSGEGIIGKRRVKFKPGTIVYMPPGMYHQMSTGSTSLEALVLFSPPLNIRDKKADICYPPQARGIK